MFQNPQLQSLLDRLQQGTPTAPRQQPVVPQQPQVSYGDHLARLQGMQQQGQQANAQLRQRVMSMAPQQGPQRLGQSLAPRQASFGQHIFPNGQLDPRYDTKNYTGGWYFDPADQAMQGGG